LENKTWTKKQDPKFIKALTAVEGVFNELSTHLYVMVSYFEQYVEAIQASPLYASAPEESKNDNEYINPTQTFPAPAEEVTE
jgi:hypothetical protein